MIRGELYIEKYDWTLYYYLDVRLNNADAVLRRIDKMGVNDRTRKRIESNLYESRANTGFTYSRLANHESIIVVSYTTNSCQMINTIAHEIRHLCDAIADEWQIDRDGETVAYLTGEVTMRMYRPITFLVCSCPKCVKYREKLR